MALKIVQDAQTIKDDSFAKNRRKIIFVTITILAK